MPIYILCHMTNWPEMPSSCSFDKIFRIYDYRITGNNQGILKFLDMSKIACGIIKFLDHIFHMQCHHAVFIGGNDERLERVEETEAIKHRLPHGGCIFADAAGEY